MVHGAWKITFSIISFQTKLNLFLDTWIWKVKRKRLGGHTDGDMWLSPKCMWIKCPSVHMDYHMRDSSVLPYDYADEWTGLVLSSATSSMNNRLFKCVRTGGHCCVCVYMLSIDFIQTVGNQWTGGARLHMHVLSLAVCLSVSLTFSLSDLELRFMGGKKKPESQVKHMY